MRTITIVKLRRRACSLESGTFLRLSRLTLKPFFIAQPIVKQSDPFALARVRSCVTSRAGCEGVDYQGGQLIMGKEIVLIRRPNSGAKRTPRDADTHTPGVCQGRIKFAPNFRRKQHQRAGRSGYRGFGPSS